MGTSEVCPEEPVLCSKKGLKRKYFFQFPRKLKKVFALKTLSESKKLVLKYQLKRYTRPEAKYESSFLPQAYEQGKMSVSIFVTGYRNSSSQIDEKSLSLF